MGRILAIDYGKKRVGLAITDREQKVAFPKKILSVNSEKDFLQKLKDIVASEEIEKIVIGLPKNRDGTLTPLGQQILQIAKTIQKNFNCPVDLIDETFTSKEAENFLIEMDVTRKKRQKLTDKIAAMLILRAYLEKNKNET